MGAEMGADMGADMGAATALISMAEIETLSLVATMAMVKVGPVVVTNKVVVYATFLPPLRTTKSRLAIFVPATVTSNTRDPLAGQL
jgi:3-deoxy-D-arabino-heptulosonate 7-phosphate (DAHP) synthase class II